MHEDIKEVLFTAEEIAKRVNEIGEQITQDFASKVQKGQGIVLVCVLRGSAIFASDLVRSINLPLEMDFMAISSYGSGTKSSGMVRIEKDLSSDIEGKHVIIIEDIIDSGLTLSFLRKDFVARKPASVTCASFLYKKGSAYPKDDVEYIGFECPDEFIVGYGLDYAQHYRNLPCACVLKPEVYGQ